MTQQTDTPSSTPGSTVPAARPLTTADVAGFQDRQARTQAASSYRVAQGADDRSKAALARIQELEGQLDVLVADARERGDEQLSQRIKEGLDSGDMSTVDAVKEMMSHQFKRLGLDPETGKPLRGSVVPLAPEGTQDVPARPAQAPLTPKEVGVNSLLIAHGLRGDEPGLSLDTSTPRATLASILNYQAAVRAASSGNGQTVTTAPDRDGGVPARAPGQPVRVEEVEAIANQSGSRGAMRPKQAAEALRHLRGQMAAPTGSTFLAE